MGDMRIYSQVSSIFVNLNFGIHVRSYRALASEAEHHGGSELAAKSSFGSEI